MSAPKELLNVQVDGVWHQFPKGTRVIEACGQAGKFVPRYCYHPKLSSPGNCRMCLIEMGMPKMGPDRKLEVGPDGKMKPMKVRSMVGLIPLFAVETLEPTHAVLLPEEYFDLWNDDYMDLIEQR